MAEIRQVGSKGFGAAWPGAAPQVSPTRGLARSPQKYCVYNQTQERFVATDVEATHAAPDGAEARLRALEQGAGTGVWILPYQEISPANIRFPVDLVFLNNDYVVLAIVESFPLASLPDSSIKAQSVLALPTDALAKGDMRAGDQLIISNPEEMKQHLQRMKEAKAEAPSSLRSFLEQFDNTSAEELPPSAMEEPVESGVNNEPAAPVAVASIEVAPVEAAPIEAAPIEAAPVKTEIAGGKKAGAKKPAASPPIETNSWKKRGETRNWFTNLLLGNPADPRKSTREPLPGLIAYFFTGGTPAPHEVRDISVTGMYIITDEGWYPGTVVRVTLTDRDHPTNDRTFTVNAKAVRRGSDGVGLEFILEKENQQRSDNTQFSERTLGANHVRVEAFLQELKKQPQQN